MVVSGQSATTYDPGILNTSTTYYWKITATDNHSNATEGAVWSFTAVTPWLCGDAYTDTRDAQSYTTIQIGTQCWMAENLNIGTMINGGSDPTNNSTIEKYCYDNNTSNCDVYGGLYQWNEMMEYVTTEGVQGICPTGWHLPTDAEWCTLENEVDVGTVDCNATGWRGTDAGGKLKEAGTSHWASPNTGATNSSGFSALPGGTRFTGGSFGNVGSGGYWWGGTESSGSNAYTRSLYYTDEQVFRSSYDKSIGLGARCIKD